MSLEAVDETELRTRMGVVLDRVDSLLREIGPLFREVGTLRAEAAMIYKELDRRGLLGPEKDGKEPTL